MPFLFLKRFSVSELGTALSADFCGIVELYLQGCSIGDVGFAKINKSLRQIKTIHKLDLSDCSLSNGSIIMLVDTLRMKSLDSNENKWIGNLRDDHPVPKKQLGVLILNDNTKIQNSIVEENVLTLRVVWKANISNLILWF